MSANADKARQSSGGKSFFSRSSKKDRRNPSDEAKYLGSELDKAGSVSSRTSRHTNRSSIASIERPDSPGGDQRGLNMMAGVITSIPYDSVSADSKSPIPVEYLPRSDQVPVRKEPLPHHLNKSAGDYHQYPSIDPTTMQNGSSHPTGPRPPPHVGNVTMASTGDRRTALQQWGPSRGRTVSTIQHNPRYDSVSTNNYSYYGRSSIDQSSMESSTER